MAIRYESAVVFVRDLDRATAFYRDVLEQRIARNRGVDILFEGGFRLIVRNHGEPDSPTLPGPCTALYFESDDLDGFLDRLLQTSARFAQPMTELPWGQRYVRFYDPDNNLIEVSEPMWAVVRRYQDMGLEYEQIAERTSMPVDAVVEILNTSPL